MSALPVSEEPPQRPPAKVIPLRPVARKRYRLHRFFRFLVRLFVSMAVLSVCVTIPLNWLTPSTTSYMIQAGAPVVQQNVSVDHISRFLIAATVAHEDEQLGTRFGAFDFNDFFSRAQAYATNQADPSGSTIPQQLAKNLYLWPSQDWVRKGVEAVLAEELDFGLPKKRIVELYLNYAQFGPKLFGVCGATWYYFNTPPSAVTQYQAAQLMGVLPDPENVRRAANGGLDLSSAADKTAVDLINGAANVWVPRQLAGMGGWQMAVATIGITDTASMHADTQNAADACSTMPQAVADRLKAEGAIK
ncbi:transglycosylase domain-containing protein [Sinomonas gamaensis]|uniref:transglycosylase domain-containing protein n=1 Tax=Sinomonas gamaensis TaxID=2565624 RepID=UPI001107E8BD|nr:transglycosylase domain-containing protein [Sinomonas gamaensis]